MSTSSRKQEHIQLAASADVRFRAKSNGLDDVELPYNALPEIDLADVDTTQHFLGKSLSLPLMITGMTGGYEDAERVNDGLANACAQLNIAFGVGSMRAAVEHPSTQSTYSVVSKYASTIPIIANIGAVQLARWSDDGSATDKCAQLCDLVGASAIAIHLNPLQEALQPEGQPHFRGVLGSIASFVADFQLSVIVKEVGAGISGEVASRLSQVGVSMIDVAGAGGTSWAGVEILRRDDANAVQEYWDMGIPTADCLRQCRGVVPTLIASGGIQSGAHIAHAIALGATIAGTALPALQAFLSGGTDGVVQLIRTWGADLRRRMFLSGSQSLHDLAQLIP